MGAPYSEDLRKRVLGVIDGGMSKWQAHQTFKIARTTIDAWLKRRSATGGVKAKTSYRRGYTAELEDTEEVRAFIEAHRQKTLSQMSDGWAEKAGKRLCITTFSNALKRLGYTRKKPHSSTGKAVWSRG